MLTLSTAYLSRQPITGKELVWQIKNLGFEGVEIDYRVTEKMYQEMLPLLDTKQIEVISLHNFSPVPDIADMPDGDALDLSTIDEEKRKKAVEYSLKTLNWAKRLAAKVVVFHFGKVEVEFNEDKLAFMYSEGLKGTKEYNQELNKLIKQRAERKQPYLEAFLRSLEAILNYADKLKLKVGIENRFFYFQIPNLEEIQMVFDKFSNSPLGYWHDTGHSCRQEFLGFYDEFSYLEQLKSFLIGCHIHDIKRRTTQDHLLPGDGDFDFNRFSTYLHHNILPVFEIHYAQDDETLKQRIPFLQEIVKNCF